MTPTHETPMSLFSHNKCGKITIKHWELDFFYFTFYLLGGCVYAPNAPPAYGPVHVYNYITQLRSLVSATDERLYSAYIITSKRINITTLRAHPSEPIRPRLHSQNFLMATATALADYARAIGLMQDVFPPAGGQTHLLPLKHSHQGQHSPVASLVMTPGGKATIANKRQK